MSGVNPRNMTARQPGEEAIVNPSRPESAIDLFSDAVLADPYPYYRQLRVAVR